jgi:hypothetical protein
LAGTAESCSLLFAGRGGGARPWPMRLGVVDRRGRKGAITEAAMRVGGVKRGCEAGRA